MSREIQLVLLGAMLAGLVVVLMLGLGDCIFPQPSRSPVDTAIQVGVGLFTVGCLWATRGTGRTPSVDTPRPSAAASNPFPKMDRKMWVLAARLVGAAAFVAWLLVPRVRVVVFECVSGVGSALLAPVLIFFHDRPRWLGDPRGVSFANPLLDLFVYFLLTLFVITPKLSFWAAKKGLLPRIGGALLIIGMGILPVAAVSSSHANGFQSSDPGYVQFRFLEVVFSWIYLVVSLLSMLMVYVQIIVGTENLPKDTSRADIDRVRGQTTLGDARPPYDDEIDAALQGGRHPSPPQFED